MSKDSRLLELSPNMGAPERNFVFAVAMKVVKNEIDAEDVAQEALLLAHRHRASFRGQSKYSTWLYRVAVTTALMHLRSKKRKCREISSSQLGANEQNWVEAMESQAPTPEQLCACRQELAEVERSVAKLGSKYARLLHLRWYEGCSDRELSRRLDLPLTTVKNRTFRARRHVLSEHGQAA